MNPVAKFTSGETKITVGLIDFYRMGRKNNPSLFFWSHFLELVKEATEVGKSLVVELDNENFFEFVSKKDWNDRGAIVDLQEEIIDLTTESGRLEARKRLGILAIRIQNGDSLLNEGSVNIGWFKFSSGKIRRAGFGWRYNKWNFGCNDIIDNPKLPAPVFHYWSRNTI